MLMRDSGSEDRTATHECLGEEQGWEMYTSASFVNRRIL